MRQIEFSQTKIQQKFKDQHGGVLRNKRKGRNARPLTTKEPIHLVFKVSKLKLKKGFRSPLGFYICNAVIKRYSKMFFVKIDQLSINSDHIHLIIRLTSRSFGQHFFRVVAGQIAQQLLKNGFWVTAASNVTDTPSSIWKHRPFTRVIRGWKAYTIARNYVMLNEKEAQGRIPYRKERLNGLSSAEWEIFRG